MTDVKRLLSEATPLPWIRPWAALTVRAGLANDDDVFQKQRNIDLAVAAVNRLPDYLVAIEALDELTDWAEGNEGQGCGWCLFSEGHDGGCIVGEASVALARLRDEVPA